MLEWGPDEPSTDHGSISMTMAFAVVALSAVNLGLVMRREREAVWSAPVFPYLGWILAGWALTWAAVELGMLQRLLDTVSLTGKQWGVALLLSLLAPAIRVGGQADPDLAPAKAAADAGARRPDPGRGRRGVEGGLIATVLASAG